MMSARRFVPSLTAIGLTALAGVLVPATAKADPYSFLAGTKWYVPQETLPATLMTLKDGTVAPVLDQTVWEIAGYKKGYFWGRSIAQFMRPDNGQPIGAASCTRMMGSVTPSGRILIEFINEADTTTRNAVQGIGTFSKSSFGLPRFEMQMATGTTFVVTHWSYMDQCKAGQACNTRLPGTTLSLANFVAKCN